MTTDRPARTSLLDELSLSRAGAVATELRRGRVGSAVSGAARVGLLVAGSAGVALGVAGLLWTGLGPGPLDVFITSIVARFGVPITFVVWAVALVMCGVSVALGRRPGPGTLLLPLVAGALLPVAMGVLVHWTPPAGIGPAVVTAHLAAVAVIGLGAGSVLVAGLGAGTGELLAGAASDRTGRPEPLVRTGVELTWLVLGFALGGTVGIGTLLVTVTIGPAVRLGHRTVARVASVTGAATWTGRLLPTG